MRIWPFLLLLACAGCLDRDTQQSEQGADAIAFIARPNGLISDEADVIAASDESRLDAKLHDVLKRTDTAFVVVTVRSLRGLDIARYTNLLANRWQLGGEKGGVMLLVAPNERKVRIEVSREIANRLSDEECARIIATSMIPHFKAGNISAGIASGASAIASHL